MHPIVARVREVFDLNPDGLLVWKRPNSSRLKPGAIAGCHVGTSKHHITLDRVHYTANRLVYAFRHGVLPSGSAFVDRDTGVAVPKKCDHQGRKITHAEALDLLSYSPQTGAFAWKRRFAKSMRVNDPVGKKTRAGYVRTHINGVEYLLHRLAWFYVHGEWPERVDHINGDRGDNRIENLRDVDARTNQENQRRAMVTNKTGLLGVSTEKQTGKFKASIKTRGRSITLGRFDSPLAAHAAYVEGKRRIHSGCTL